MSTKPPRSGYTGSLRARLAAARRYAIPSQRLSQTIAEFAWPALTELDEDATVDDISQVYDFAVEIWNAHALAHPAWNRPEALQTLASRIASGDFPAHIVGLFHVLSEHRVSRFANDPRFVVDFELATDEAGRVHVSCAAKIPAGTTVPASGDASTT